MSFTDQYGGNSNGLNINLSGQKPSYSQQFGGSNGTLSEKRKQEKKGANAADIITASAGGLDSVTGFISSIMGNGTPTANNYTPPPPPEKKVNPLLIGGIVAGVFLLIIVLILTKNGQAKQ